ncbi:hypothetical protein TeGR_g3464 [Tetraparma gracilis]|uniref:RING-type domain-containing protein n=1 Tax=Tetraparma gracilis TaxID=2962635 RepID=A0ABQ6MMR9_9STRA|nr:hypothetical protein TeGR_g3464 [Tetraparma gracilis]
MASLPRRLSASLSSSASSAYLHSSALATSLASSLGAPAADCLICYESFLSASPALARPPCCGQVICASCVAQHVAAVTSSPTAAALLCPACNVPLPDAFARAAVGSPLPAAAWPAAALRRTSLYERWSIRAALAASPEPEALLCCPRLDCENAWVLPLASRRRKLAREPTSRLRSPLRALLYSPPLAASGDLRRVYCDLCRAAFCYLCLQPWSRVAAGHRTPGRVSFRAPRSLPPATSHHGRSCAAFAPARVFRAADAEFAGVAAGAGARPCPACSLRVARSEGCNHISCPCGAHWCFVCGVRWGAGHYACRNEEGVTYVRREAEGCAVQ